MNKISAIVPVWNAHKYLHRWIDSILSQTYRNIQLLLFDDGSPDNSLKIREEYVKKGKKVRVFHKASGGQASARNYGFEYATGEFVDNDDRIFPSMYERLHHLMIEYSTDIDRCDGMRGRMEACVSVEKNAIAVTETTQFFKKIYQDI